MVTYISSPVFPPPTPPPTSSAPAALKTPPSPSETFFLAFVVFYSCTFESLVEDKRHVRGPILVLVRMGTVSEEGEEAQTSNKVRRWVKWTRTAAEFSKSWCTTCWHLCACVRVCVWETEYAHPGVIAGCNITQTHKSVPEKRRTTRSWGKIMSAPAWSRDCCLMLFFKF